MNAGENEEDPEIDELAMDDLKPEADFSDDDDEFDALMRAGNFAIDDDDPDAVLDEEEDEFGFQGEDDENLFGSLSGFEELPGSRVHDHDSSGIPGWDDDRA